MKNEYDFSNARKNPYADRVKQEIGLNPNQNTVQCFKDPGRTNRPSLSKDQSVSDRLRKQETAAGNQLDSRLKNTEGRISKR